MKKRNQTAINNRMNKKARQLPPLELKKNLYIGHGRVKTFGEKK